jgi:WD40-like Beta Propeller Repeat
MRPVFAAVAVLIFALSTPDQGKESLPLTGPYLGQKPPGMAPELFAPGIISTCTQHGSAYFSPDGREVYFSRMLPRPSVIMYMREENGRWTPPRVVCEGLTPGLAPDGRTVLFSTWELWRMFKTPAGWTAPDKFGPAINFQKRQDTPYAAANGALYFCSMFGDRNGIYRAEFKDGAYGRPERLEYGISSGYGDFSPCIAPDESYLVFASTRPGYGVTDLYVSFKTSDGSWTAPKNMGPAINTGAKEACPFVSFDGKYLFFMSNRVSELNPSPIPDGPGNVYWVDARVIKSLAPARKAR